MKEERTLCETRKDKKDKPKILHNIPRNDLTM